MINRRNGLRRQFLEIKEEPLEFGSKEANGNMQYIKHVLTVYVIN